MPNKFTVKAVESADEWQSQYGPMVTWTLAGTWESGYAETIQVNSKPTHKYKVGDSFHAEPTGKSYKGIDRYKRVKPPEGSESAPQSSGNAPSSHSEPKRAPMAYETATLLLKRLLDDFGVEASSFIFEAILDGKVENPVKPKTIVKSFGRDLETAGVEQAAWDEIFSLCERLAKETDAKNVRALLIATCGVETRTDLDAKKAQLFIETLKTNLAAIEAAKSQEEPDDISF